MTDRLSLEELFEGAARLNTALLLVKSGDRDHAEHARDLAHRWFELWFRIDRIIRSWNSGPHPGWLPDHSLRELREVLTEVYRLRCVAVGIDPGKAVAGG